MGRRNRVFDTGLNGFSQELIQAVQKRSLPLASDQDLTPLIAKIQNKPYVLIGEASHGTSEFYRWRARLSQKLIESGAYKFVAVEGDWPDCYLMNRFVKAMPGAPKNAREALRFAYERWPSWMWANEDVADFLDWLRAYNDKKPMEEKVGFFGLDVYSLWESMEALARNLDKLPREAAEALTQMIHCFEPYFEDAYDYTRASQSSTRSCEDKVASLFEKLAKDRVTQEADGKDGAFDKEQNAFVLKSAEKYYRTMMHGRAESWNVRDTHFMDTLDRLMAHHGEGARSIVWAHNTHVGDARFTDMAEGGEVNIGQLCRERHGAEKCFLVGFGSYEGTVTAGRAWDAPTETMNLPKGRKGSWEDLMHKAGAEDKLLLFTGEENEGDLLQKLGHRAVGVVYRPQHEHFGNYVPTYLTKRYDAFLYIEKTKALKPLHGPMVESHELPETYPFAT